MAILRGGKRIGGFDIRIGLPRDRSLDNVNNDARFKQRAGGNPETTMGRFQAMVNESEGFARKARYYVEFYLPKSIPITGVNAGDENNEVSGVSVEQQMAFKHYVSDMNIFQLGSFESRNERDDVTYGVKLFDCFPKIVSKVDYAHTANEIQTFSVSFEYRNWVNYFIDKAGQVELGTPNFRDVTVKSGGGPFGGLLGKLPPELRRAGTEVLQGIKRRLPIGGITGGRVFPPFPNFPPLNI